MYQRWIYIDLKSNVICWTTVKKLLCSKIRKYEVHQHNLKPHAAFIKRKSDKSIKPKTSIKTSATGFSVSLCTSNTLHSQSVLVRTHCCVTADPEIERKLKIGKLGHQLSSMQSSLFHCVSFSAVISAAGQWEDCQFDLWLHGNSLHFNQIHFPEYLLIWPRVRSETN